MTNLHACIHTYRDVRRIIVHGHKPLYCSSPTPYECDSWYTRQREGVPLPNNGTATIEKHFGLEKLFYAHGVDIYLCGHQHNAERHYDVAFGETTGATIDPPSTTYIVTGCVFCLLTGTCIRVCTRTSCGTSHTPTPTPSKHPTHPKKTAPGAIART